MASPRLGLVVGDKLSKLSCMADVSSQLMSCCCYVTKRESTSWVFVVSVVFQVLVLSPCLPSSLCVNV